MRTTRTLEPQLIKANGRADMNTMLKKIFATDDELLAYCTANKTDTALALYDHHRALKIPDYIKNAIR